MPTYSIRDLENYTQIKAHTIRIWEQRYQLLQPKRTEGNVRYYTENDLKKILNINLLYTNGLKISKIARLEDNEIVERARELIEDHNQELSLNPNIEGLIIGITALDENAVREGLKEAEAAFGMLGMYKEVIVPLLIRIGELWQISSLTVGHEHFFSNLLRDFYILRTNNLPSVKSDAPKALLFLSDEEDHELSLLFYAYLLKEKGYRVTYLGTRVPFEDVQIISEQLKPDLYITSFISKISLEQFTGQIEQLTSFVEIGKLRVGGALALEYKEYLPKDVKFLHSEVQLLN